MWKSWKEKIIDFFYEEVESEQSINMPQQEKSKYPATRERYAGTSSKRSISMENRSVDTKVAYQYPKKHMAPFRFPVIADQKKERTPMKNNHQKRATIQRKLKAKTEAYASKNELNVRTHKRKQRQKDLENVPAYVRRRLELDRQREQEREIAPEETPNTEIEQTESVEEQKVNGSPIIDLEMVEHTKPEELDEVFRKRDGVFQQKEQIEVEEITKYSPSFEQDTNNDFSFDMEEEKVSVDPNLNVEEEPIQEEKVDLTLYKEEPMQKTEPLQEDTSMRDEAFSSTTFHDDTITESEQEIPHEVHQPVQPAYVEEKQDIPNYLLNDPVAPNEDDSDWLIEQQILLEDTFRHFHIDANVVNVTQGPSVTRFEVQPALGVKVSKIRNLADDLKLNLAAKDIRIEAPIPGKNTVGIEVPNQYPKMVTLQKLIETDDFRESASPLTIALGLSIEGDPLITNIDKMPHGLIAGATGSGKSVCINTIILSLLYKADYREVKFLLIDPKMVELTPYNGIPHLLSPVITDTKAATAALKWAVTEMESRYERFVEAGVRNIQKYNEKMVKANKPEEKMSYIVIIIDELADLMMVSPQEVEDAICRIAQKARACGMHLLLATQRPSVDVITGLIKANIPTRIAFSVSSQIDSRTMLDNNGAEKLLGKGDMLFVENGANKSMRLQGPFVSDEEIDRVASYTRSIAEPQYLFEQEQLLVEVEHEDEDELLPDVIAFVTSQNRASTSLLQRRFRIGYNRAARLIDSLEDKGIISAQNGSKPRDILVTQSQIDDLI